MIQRIQSIWLLITSTLAFASLQLSFYTGNIFTDKTVNPAIKLYQEINARYNIGLNIITIAIGLIALISIFLFRQRKLQMRLCLVAVLLELLVVLQYYFAIKKFAEGNLSLTSIIQPLIIISIFLAMKGIRKDEKIISESDRLR